MRIGVIRRFNDTKLFHNWLYAKPWWDRFFENGARIDVFPGFTQRGRAQSGLPRPPYYWL